MDAGWVALAITLAFGLALWAVSRVYRAWLARTSDYAELLARHGLPRDERPLVLGFTADDCLPCKTQQHPALERLRTRIGDAADIREVEALQQAELAQRFGVLTVPTTVVLDQRRRIVAINYGVASAEKLAGQVMPLINRR